MTKARSILRLAWSLAIAFAMTLVLLFILILLIDSGYDKALVHLCGGFFFFLRENLTKLSTDAATWGPGIVAFCLALVIAHRFLHQHAVSKNRRWSFVTTTCLGLVVPVLFVIAFIVPGALLQVKSLASIPWFERSSSPPGHDTPPESSDRACGRALQDTGSN